jgi:3-phosphoshikimate 1-carboxyvinyltransferase
MSDLTLIPASQPWTAAFRPPGSKSLTHRAVVLAALAGGACRLSNILLADDTQVMLDSLGRLGFDLQLDWAAKTLTIAGKGGKIPVPHAELACGNSGTTIRFLAALCALGQDHYELDGVPRMRQRPIGELVDLLRNLGVRAEYLGQSGYPPIRVFGGDLPGGLLRYGSALSSQYLSAVLMIAPFARNEVQIDLEGRQTSWPYVAMTMRLMDQFGHTPELLRDPDTGEPRRIIIPRGQYQPTDYAVEPDASNAGYFLAAAALHPGAKITIENLGKSSLQGDVGFADLLHRMGADLVFGPDFITVTGTDRLEGIDADLSDMPDMAQTLAVTALFAHGPTTLRGLHTLRVKETDRLAALQTELTKLGASVEVEEDTLHIDPPDSVTPATIDTYDDHRMAMSFALAGTRANGVTIRDIECTAKTYPKFFEDLKSVGAAQ